MDNVWRRECMRERAPVPEQRLSRMGGSMERQQSRSFAPNKYAVTLVALALLFVASHPLA
jgi:hypothetical protein